MDSKNIRFLIPSIILLILSGLGVFFIFKINSPPKNVNLIATLTPVPTQIPTITLTPTATSSAEITITPTATSSTRTKTTPTPKIKNTVTPTSAPTPATNSGLLIFKNTADKFSVSYNSSRKPYQDTESTGNRYTFYSPSGNFAVHVSPSGTWAWTNSDRNFSSALIVSGQNTYRYDIATQTIVDLQSSTKNYTIQCIHNGNEILKTECEGFIKSFTLL